MGWLENLASNLPQNAENAGYKSEMENQLNQARVRQMVEEARQKSQDLALREKEFGLKQSQHPYEVLKNIATSDYMNAQAQHMLRPPVVNREQELKADKLVEEAGLAAAIPMLERYKSVLTDKSAPTLFNEFKGNFEKLPKTLQPFFGTKDHVILGQDELEKAITHARQLHPSLNRIENTTIKEDGQDRRKQLDIEHKDAVAKAKNDSQERIAKIMADAKKAGKTLSPSQAQTAEYQRMYEAKEISRPVYLDLLAQANRDTKPGQPTFGVGPNGKTIITTPTPETPSSILRKNGVGGMNVRTEGDPNVNDMRKRLKELSGGQ